MQIFDIKVKVLDGVILPGYQTDGSSGLDLTSYEDGMIDAFDVKLVRTGLFLELPSGLEGQVRTRSGLALKNRVIVLNSPGTIDSDYRGEIKLILMNLGRQKFNYRKGDRLAQIVFSQIAKVKLNVVEDISNTLRGEGGFGHTGI
jgi:dUTP pyrophosphatase